MHYEKKCPSCNQWTAWHRTSANRCVHCNVMLGEALIPVHTAQEPSPTPPPSFLVIRPEDGGLMRLTRRVAFTAHLVYAGIMWFFMMVFAALVH